MNPSRLKLCVGVSAAALTMSWTTSAGVASAEPDLSPLINTTCSYSQIVAALDAQAPDLAEKLSQYPQAQAKLQQFLALPANGRQQMIQEGLAAYPQWHQQAGSPQGQVYAGLLTQIANTCQNY
jgi:hemophore-related protein